MDYEGITGNLLAKLKKHDEWSYWHSIRVEGYALEIGKRSEERRVGKECRL